MGIFLFQTHILNCQLMFLECTVFSEIICIFHFQAAAIAILLIGTDLEDARERIPILEDYQVATSTSQPLALTKSEVQLIASNISQRKLAEMVSNEKLICNSHN